MTNRKNRRLSLLLECCDVALK